MTDDEPAGVSDLTASQPKAQVYVLRVWREGGDGSASVRLRIVPAAGDVAPRYFTSWRALVEWGERDGRQSTPVDDASINGPPKE